MRTKLMDPVVISGFGVVSPLGNSVQELTQRFANGERAPRQLDDSISIDIPLATIPADKQTRIGRLDRLCRLFLSATYLAVDAAQLRIASDEAERVGLAFGTGFGCLLTDAEFNQKVVEQGPAAASPRLFAYTVSSAAAGEVSIALGIKGPNATAHMGLAAGLGAVGYGFDLIRMGKADVVLAGGADAIGPALIDGLCDMGLVRRDVAGPGIVPSEAAVVLVLERRDHAVGRGAPNWGRIDGYAAGFEPTLTRRQRDCTGVSATISRALASSDHAAGAVDLVMSSAHGTAVDATECAGLAEALGSANSALVLAPKAATGECFAASGVLSLALAAGLLRGQPQLADGLACGIDGQSVASTDATRRLRAASVVLLNSLCYSGTVVSLVLGRES